MPAKISSKISHAWHHTRKRRLAAALLVLFAIINGGIYLAYRERTYPNTTINGHHVGSLAQAKLPERLRQLALLPEKVRLTYEGKTITVPTAALGMSIDYQQTARELTGQRSWLPAANFFVRSDVPLFIAIQPKTYQQKILEIGRGYKTGPTDAVLSLKAGNFVITPEKDARAIDPSGTQARIVAALGNGQDSAELMMKHIPPRVTRASLQPQLDALQAQRNTAVTLTFQNKTKKFTPDEIGSWFVAFKDSYALSAEKVRDGVADAGLELGANVSNADDIAASVKQAVEAKRTTSLALAGRPLGSRSYSYCTAGRGVPDADVAGMTDIIKRTLNAKRGWSIGGNISFKQSDSSCDFTIWLAAAEQMPSFGAICDRYWSCAVRPNVIFNHDRWRYTSDAWQKTGGSLEDYRVMVINHEVGHWLGFDHSNCPAAGQPAPVMQQQSIDLQGCVFNPWPSTTERLALRDFLGL